MSIIYVKKLALEKVKLLTRKVKKKMSEAKQGKSRPEGAGG